MPTVRQQRKDEIKEVIDRLLPDRPEGTAEVVRQGLLRQRTRVNKCFHPYLTKRQQTVLQGKPRMARAWQRILRDMEDNNMTMKEFVETLSPEELVRGMVKNKNGHFSGRPPKWVPREFHRACIDELMKRGQRLWQQHYLEAIQAMTEIARGEGAGQYATPGERIKAAQFVIERLEGKVPERLTVTSEQPWALVLDGIVAEVSDEAVAKGQKLLESAQDAADEILDAELIDEEPDPVPVRSRRRRR